jgi:GntR family transcriptional regulator
MQTDLEFPIRQPSLADQVCEIIIEGIANGLYPPGSMLPSENQLAERFGVSRSTIRAAFARLGEKGYVRRKRGVGTFVAESPEIIAPIYQQPGAYDRIVAQGFEPGVIQIKTEMIEIGDVIAEKLTIDPGSSVLRVERIFTADKKPVIWFTGYIPQKIFKEHLSSELILEPEFTDSFIKFFPRYCNIEVIYLASKYNPDIVENCLLPDIFNQVGPNTPVLVGESIGYDQQHTPLFLSEEYMVGRERAVHLLQWLGARV